MYGDELKADRKELIMDNNELDQLKAWGKLIKPSFPSHAEIEHYNRNRDGYVELDWRLGSDPNRPNKQSRKFQILISWETMRDYHALGSEQRSEWDVKFKKEVLKRFEKFNPEHDSPYGQSPPEERCLIHSRLFH